MERLIRLLRIINIIQVSPGIKAKELAVLCEISERNIYRDLEILNAANLPITNEGHSKGYKFIGRFKQYPLNWEEDELQAFKILPVLLGEKYKTKAFMSAYEKVMATHKVEKIERNTLLSDISRVIQSGKSTEILDEKELLSSIIDAVLSSRTIEAIYHTQSRNTITTRKIDPYFLMPRKDRLYIIGHDHKSNEMRIFRLNRFQSIKVLNIKFTKNELQLEKYLHNTWSIIRGEKNIHFKVKFSQDIARYIREGEYNVTPKFIDFPDGSLLFEITVNDDREILKWIMQYGPDAEIIEPKSYRMKMKDMLQRWTNIY